MNPSNADFAIGDEVINLRSHRIGTVQAVVRLPDHPTREFIVVRHQYNNDQPLTVWPRIGCRRLNEADRMMIDRCLQKIQAAFPSIGTVHRTMLVEELGRASDDPVARLEQVLDCRLPSHRFGNHKPLRLDDVLTIYMKGHSRIRKRNLPVPMLSPNVVVRNIRADRLGKVMAMTHRDGVPVYRVAVKQWLNRRNRPIRAERVWAAASCRAVSLDEAKSFLQANGFVD